MVRSLLLLRASDVMEMQSRVGEAVTLVVAGTAPLEACPVGPRRFADCLSDVLKMLPYLSSKSF